MVMRGKCLLAVSWHKIMIRLCQADLSGYYFNYEHVPHNKIIINIDIRSNKCRHIDLDYQDSVHIRPQVGHKSRT